VDIDLYNTFDYKAVSQKCSVSAVGRVLTRHWLRFMKFPLNPHQWSMAVLPPAPRRRLQLTGNWCDWRGKALNGDSLPTTNKVLLMQTCVCQPFDAHGCNNGLSYKTSALSVRVPGCQKLQTTA